MLSPAMNFVVGGFTMLGLSFLAGALLRDAVDPRRGLIARWLPNWISQTESGILGFLAMIMALLVFPVMDRIGL